MAEKPREPFVYHPKSDTELETIAQNLAAGHIWTDISGHLDPTMTFMPLMFMDQEMIKEMEEQKITRLYEYMDKAGPRSVNGEPNFFSVQMLNDTDWAKVHKKWKEIDAFMKSRAANAKA